MCPKKEFLQDNWIYELPDSEDKSCSTLTVQVDVHNPKAPPLLFPVVAPRRAQTLEKFWTSRMRVESGEV